MPPAQTVLCNHIRRREVIRFMYLEGLREVEPHLLGTDEDGDLTLSAWQRSGLTPQGWRDFHVKKMQGITITGQRFLRARPGYNRLDTTIQNIICRLSVRRGRPAGGRK